MPEYIGKETTITVGQKTYRLSRFTRKVLFDFMKWADKELGHPLDAIKEHLEGFSPALQELMVKDALENARMRRSVNSPEIQNLMATPQGSMKLVALLFQQYHSDLSEQQIDDIYEAAAQEHGEGYLESKIAEAQGIILKPESQLEKEGLQALGALEPDDDEKKVRRKNLKTG